MKKITLFILISIILSSCATLNNNNNKADLYPDIYKEKPVSILIMPPINNTVHVEAKDYFYTSLAKPLCEMGYYVVSPFLAMQIFKTESAYDSELFIDGNLAPFNNVFGADAALFTIINGWEKSTIGKSITVNIKYVIKSTHTNEIIFSREGTLSVNYDTNTGQTGIASLVGMAVDMLRTAMTDKVVVARECNNYVLKDMPCGCYSPKFGTDQESKIFGKNFDAKINK